jgi:hypothetical protein
MRYLFFCWCGRIPPRRIMKEMIGVKWACYSYSLCLSLSQALSLMVFPFLPASNLFFPVGFVIAER